MNKENSKTILGLDLGSNSIGWALLKEESGQVSKIIDLGSRIFNKAVEEKVPTPKNQKRRDMRLGRRVLQRRARRKQKMINYLISLDLLPQELSNNFGKEKLLNELGDPYELRTKGLDTQLKPYELGRVLLHFVARRGFLSSKKQIAGDLIDDPDTLAYLAELDDKPSKNKKDKEETAFKADISEVYRAIKENNARTLGEYLFNLKNGKVKRNRSHDGGHLRTDRAMYKDELSEIWKMQAQYFPNLPDDFMEENAGVQKTIFYQRPLKLKKDRVGRCSLEPEKFRANTARLEVQRFRYLQDINNLEYFERQTEQFLKLSDEQKQKLIHYFEHHPKITITALRKLFGFDRKTEVNLEMKNLKGNITACEIRAVIGERWDELADKTWDKHKNKTQQEALFEDLFTIKKKSALKARLITHWDFDPKTAVKLCLIEFEPSHSNHSLKAINKLLPYLEQGLIYSKKDKTTGEIGALQAAGYYDKKEDVDVQDTLPLPTGKFETSNPIVNKGLHELKRVINAIIKENGKPDIIRIEMARDLEMNTKRYKEHQFQQNKNTKANEAAQDAFSGLNLGKKYASHDDKIRYRLWQDQDKRCAYSGESIALNQVFTSATEIDHILPYKKSLDNSYMNKVICFVKENRDKSDRTPTDAWGNNENKWNQITQAISRWKGVDSKVKRFYQTESDLQKRDFISSQLNDTRYISRLAQEYVKQLGCGVSVTKGYVVAEIRHQWGFNSLIGETSKKERTDHRHHAIDAVVIGATSLSLYKKAVKQIQQNMLEIPPPYADIRDELKRKLKHVIVSHATQRKLLGALHEETGAGYIAKHGGLVYRKTLNPEFTIKNTQSIVDETVRELVTTHIANYDGSVKEAMTETVYHKDGKTPIKRVRVLQSKTTEKKLEQTKFGVKDKSGKVFKYMSYGNTHHVEIIRHKKTGKITGEFVTMMLASRRAKGIGIPKQAIIKTEHGDDYEFIMALHINDIVSIEQDTKVLFYKVQQIDGEGKRIQITLHSDAHKAKKIPKNKTMLKAITTFMSDEYKLKKHQLNAIGHFIND